MNSLTLLAPAHQLPTEGADAPAFDTGNTHSDQQLVRYFATLVAGRSASFSVDEDGQVTPVYGNYPFELVYLRLTSDSGQTAPAIDLTPTSTRVYLGAAANGINAFDADDGVRQLVENIGHNIADATRGLGANPVPLVRWQPENHTLHFLGAWLADAATLDGLRTRSPSDGVAVVLEEAEIEGHGTSATVAALAVLGITLTLSPAGGNDHTSANPLAELASLAASDLFMPDAIPGGALDNPGGYTTDTHGHYDIVAVRAPGQDPARVDTDGLESVEPANTQIIVDVSAQRAYLLDGSGHILIDTPVSTARRGKITPRGEFTITQRVRTGKRSAVYACALPCWMRLDQSAIGLHIGDLPGYPASAGCIRLPGEIAPVFFDHTVSGSSVQVLNSWHKTAPDTRLAASR